MKILQLCPRFPYPLKDGGRIGIFNITKHLTLRGHSIDMITFAEDDTTPDAIQEMERYCRVSIIHDNTKTNGKNFLRSMMRNEPVYITRHRSEPFRAVVREHLRSGNYDIVYGDHSAMFPYLLEAKRLAGLPAAMRLHNVENMIWHRYAKEEKNPIKKFIAYRQAIMLERIEARCAALVDVNFAITDIDKARMEQISPRARVVTVLPGVDSDHWRQAPYASGSSVGILANTFSWIHNVNGVLWFIERVMPMIQKDIPGFSLELLGLNPPPVLLKKASNAVHVRGYVEDIRPNIARAGVYVVPLHVGSGIRIKILEAMAMGIPVVSTSVGCEGIPATDGKNIMIADSAEEFARAVTTILSDPARAAQMGNAARQFIEERFRWSHAAEMIEQEFARIAASVCSGQNITH
ncbi:MAG TPA: glycosyltransferase family 4 protein [Candidatus Kapabacteria bacterium]|nr:glycosyltransferase family 4 protein [Candidatus Kapabacteria bacterium]